MTTTSAPFIRPLSLGELLDQAFRLYRKNFLTLMGVIAIPYLPLILLQGLSSFTMFSTLANNNAAAAIESFGYWAGLGGTYLIVFLQYFLVNGIGAAGVARVVANSYTNRPTGILEVYRSLGSRLWQVIWTMLAVGLVFIAVLIWTMVPCAGWVTGPGVLTFMGAIIVPLVVPVTVLERQGGFGAFRRAWDLSRSRFWWLVGFSFVLYLLSFLVVNIPVMLASYGVTFLLGSQLDSSLAATIGTIFSTLTAAATGLLFVPLSITAMTVVYFDLRVRSEGLDLALQAASQTDPEANIATLAETTPSAPLGAFLTGTDVAHFALLSLSFIALYVILVGIVMIPIFFMAQAMN